MKACNVTKQTSNRNLPPEVVECIDRGRPRRKRGDGTDLVSVHADRVSTEEHRTAGPVHVGVQYWGS